VFAILVGAAGLKLPRDRRQRLQDGLETVTDLMTGIVHFALKLAPYAVPAMIFSVVVKVGFDIIIALGLFVVGCVAMLLLHLFGTMSLWIRFLAKRSPAEFFRQIKDVLVTAFSTSSSSATLPAALAAAARAARRRALDRRLRAAARHDHEHERHGALRGLRRAVRRAGVSACTSTLSRRSRWCSCPC